MPELRVVLDTNVIPKFLALAVDGKADMIVTGDKDLLVLETFKNTQILTPRQFLNQL